MKLKFELSPLWLLTGVVAIGLTVMAPPTATAEETATQTPAGSSETIDVDQDTEPVAQPALRAGRVVHVDPATGRKTLPSQAQRAAGPAHLGSMVNRSSAGLIETASPSSGVMVNLLGRFRHATVLAVNDSGDVAAECSATVPAEPTAASQEVDSD